MKIQRWPAILIIAGLVLIGLYFFSFGKGNLDVSIEHADYIMPAAYKVYANPDALHGEYYLFKMLLTNKGKSALNDVRISYSVPNYLDWTDLVTIPKIYPGQHSVVVCYPEFKDDIAEKMTQSNEKAEIKIKYNTGQEKDEDFSFSMMGRNQLVYTDLQPDEIATYQDMFRNQDMVGCYVTPEDPIIKYYAQQIQDKVMKGEEASESGKPEDAAKFLLGVYEATLISHMVYSGTEGIPQKLGDVSSLVQSVRLPREVVTGNTGLCIELSMMYASILKEAGLHPVIFMIPGHAYPGVNVNGQYYAIEATGIGGEGLGGKMGPADAFKAGMKELNQFFQAAQAGDPRYSILDIDNLESEGVVPMELKDDNFLRQKVDEITASWGGGGGGGGGGAQFQNQGMANNGNGGGGGGGGGETGISSYQGIISFKYPSGWQRRDYPAPQWPFLVSFIAPSSQAANIDVYQINGAMNGMQAMAYIRRQAANIGVYINFQLQGQSNGYTIFAGTTTSTTGVKQWKGVFRSSSNGQVGVTIGSSNYAQFSGEINAILSSVN